MKVGYCQLPFPTPLDCNSVKDQPCQLFGPGVVCGSDGVDYPNSCHLAQAICAYPSLYLVGNGSCASVGYTSVTSRPRTMSTRETTSQTTSLISILTSQATSSDPLTVICSTIDKVTCASDIEPVCGTDERTYINYCEFHKEVCQHPDLKVKHIGFC